MTTNDTQLSRVTLPQGAIAYRAAGPADSPHPPVVFVHGLLVDHTLWKPVADLLADQGIRSYTPNWPLGSHRIPMSADADLSPRGLARIIQGFLVALDLYDATLVGSDTGGGLCQFTIDTDHRRVGRLVLTNCDAFERFPPPEFAPVIKLGRHPQLFRMAMAALTIAPIRQSRLGYGLVFESQPDADVTRRWIEPALRQAAIRRDTAKVMATIRPQESLDIATRFDDFTKPVHILWGDNDAFFPLSVAERLAAAFPNSSLTTIPGARTFIPMDHPHQVAAVIASAGGATS